MPIAEFFPTVWNAARTTQRVLPLMGRPYTTTTLQPPPLAPMGQLPTTDAERDLATPSVLTIGTESVDLGRLQPGTLTPSEQTLIPIASQKFTGMRAETFSGSSGQAPTQILFSSIGQPLTFEGRITSLEQKSDNLAVLQQSSENPHISALHQVPRLSPGTAADLRAAQQAGSPVKITSDGLSLSMTPLDAIPMAQKGQSSFMGTRVQGNQPSLGR